MRKQHLHHDVTIERPSHPKLRSKRRRKPPPPGVVLLTPKQVKAGRQLAAKFAARA